MPVKTHVNVSIYNVKGQKVKTLVNGVKNKGEQNISWNGTDETGNSVASGVYFYRIKTKNKTISKKMLLLK